MGPGGGHHLQALHERAGVELRLGRLVAVHDAAAGDFTSVRRRPAARRWQPVDADHVLVAVGVRPATEWTPWPAGIPVDAEAGRRSPRLRRRRRDRRRALGGRRPPGHRRRPRDARPAAARRAAAARLVRPARRPDPAHRRPARRRRRSATSPTPATAGIAAVVLMNNPGGLERPAASSTPRSRRPHDPHRPDRRRRLPRARRLRPRRARRLRVTGDVAELVGPGTDDQLRAAARACPAGAIILFDAETGEEVDP